MTLFWIGVAALWLGWAAVMSITKFATMDETSV